MASNEQRIRVIGERRAQLNLRALADLIVTAAQTELPSEDDRGPRPPTRIERPAK
ncbi:hypothetical protein GCM10009853_010310 [Glycomyces scopariae]